VRSPPVYPVVPRGRLWQPRLATPERTAGLKNEKVYLRLIYTTMHCAGAEIDFFFIFIPRSLDCIVVLLLCHTARVYNKNRDRNNNK